MRDAPALSVIEQSLCHLNSVHPGTNSRALFPPDSLRPRTTWLPVPAAAISGEKESLRNLGSPWLAMGLALWLVVLFGPVAAADNVDVIHLKNGDRLTCEIKRLDRSVLSISTDPLGKASVHWGEVADLSSPRAFDVQLGSGEHYLGALAASPPGADSVATSCTRVIGSGQPMLASPTRTSSFRKNPPVSRLKPPSAGSWISSRQRRRTSGLPTALCRISI